MKTSSNNRFALIKVISRLIILLSPLAVFAQETTPVPTAGHKGEMFISWGWNRSSYSNSNIHFQGNGYDFTLSSVKAVDRQSFFSADLYFNPRTITIPQPNFRMGYFISDHYNIVFAVDHMKYIMQANQTVKIDGTIDLEDNPYNGTYDNEDIQLRPDFLQFEHTDGLNYVNLGIARHDDLLEIEKLRMTVGLTEGFSAGILYPKTNTQLLGMERYDQFHVSGYGMDLRVGLNLNFFKYVFLLGELKGGYINMPNIRTTQSTQDKASQSFFFAETIFSFGAIFPLVKPKTE